MISQYDTQQKMLSKILNEFDFNRVHLTMKHLGWEWFSVGVPSIDDLRLGARQRIDSAIKGCLMDVTDGQEYICSSGGLKATVIKNDYGQIEFVELEFILTSWETNSTEL